MVELIRKGKLADMSRLTAHNILALGKSVMQAHLDRVTDKLAAKHSRAPGATGAGALARITGRGLKRLQEATAEQRAGEVMGIIPLAQHMAVHEFGEVIKAKGRGYLTIPLPAALNADGTPKKPSALLWKKARVIKPRRGNLLIAVREGRQWIPLYALKEQVTIPARLGLRKELRKDRPQQMREVRAGIKGLLQA